MVIPLYPQPNIYMVLIHFTDGETEVYESLSSNLKPAASLSLMKIPTNWSPCSHMLGVVNAHHTLEIKGWGQPQVISLT